MILQNHLIHLGAKYAPCMRWDEVLDREVHEERLKERDTACCIRKDRAGCVQSPKTECSKVGDTVVTNNNNPPRSNWVSDVHSIHHNSPIYVIPELVRTGFEPTLRK